VTLFTRQLRGILEFAQQVNAVDTSAVADVTAPPPSGEDTLRDDTILPSLPRAQVLALAPDADAGSGLFKVPRVFTR
jgi:aspartyl/glutamyl-tRNA(Asn/Gln) amidotransferase C subunit